MDEPRTLTIPGFVNAHCHAFQGARGRRTGGDLGLAGDNDLGGRAPHAGDCAARVRRDLPRASRRRLHGRGRVPLPRSSEANAAIEAAADAGIEIVLFLSAYARGGVERFRQESTAEYFHQLEELRENGVRVGCAPHSVRACPPDWLEEIGAYAERERLPLHVHADEQPREIVECLAEHGVRPIELLARTGCLGPRTTVVHATHADDRELDLLAEAGVRVCICPTTEGNLGDGFAPLERLRQRGIGICIGSDSNVRIDPLEELRELETTARREALSREVFDAGTLLCFGADEGAASLGLESWPDAAVDLEHASLRGVERGDVLDALVFGCGADVFVEG